MRARALPLSLATARHLETILLCRRHPSPTLRASSPPVASVGGGGATTKGSSRHHFPIVARAHAHATTSARAMASSAAASSAPPLPAPQPTPETDEVKTVVSSGVAEVLLDRPRALNALNVPMVQALRRLHAGWDAEAAAAGRQGAGVGAVVLRAAAPVRDRAFCAGGDVKGVVQDARAGRVREALAFFEHEYACDWAIGGPLAAELERASPRGGAVPRSPSSSSPSSPPPLLPLRVALVDGIVMGGGVGLSLHGHAVVATERTVFAMPEVAIGLHPDVGAMARLVGGAGAAAAAAEAVGAPSAPSGAAAAAALPSPSPLHGGLLTPRVGLWLALSGARVGGGALKALGLATHCVPSLRLDQAVAALRRQGENGGGGAKGGASFAGDPAALSAALAAFEFASEEEADDAAVEDARKQAEAKARRAGAPASSSAAAAAPPPAAVAAAAMTARELRARLPLIESCFGAGDDAQRRGDPGAAVAAIVAALRSAAANADGNANAAADAAAAAAAGARFAAATADAIEGGSALSAAVTLEYAARAAAGGWGLRECLAADYALMQRFVAGKEGDFWEGVRAKLVDKGAGGAAAARWRFPSPGAVPPSAVASMFSGPLDPEDAERVLRGAGIWEGQQQQQNTGRARL